MHCFSATFNCRRWVCLLHYGFATHGWRYNKRTKMHCPNCAKSQFNKFSPNEIAAGCRSFVVHCGFCCVFSIFICTWSTHSVRGEERAALGSKWSLRKHLIRQASESSLSKLEHCVNWRLHKLILRSQEKSLSLLKVFSPFLLPRKTKSFDPW